MCLILRPFLKDSAYRLRIGNRPDPQLRRSGARARGVLASASVGSLSEQREGRPLSYSLRSPSADAIAGEQRSKRFGLTFIEFHGQPASDRVDTGRDYLGDFLKSISLMAIASP